MECSHAYLEKNIDYVLCNKEPKPNRTNRTEISRAMCPHQAHCPKENCHKLTASWLKCVKLAEANQKAYDEVFPVDMPMDVEAQKKSTRRTRKPKAEE